MNINEIAWEMAKRLAQFLVLGNWVEMVYVVNPLEAPGLEEDEQVSVIVKKHKKLVGEKCDGGKDA